MKRPLITIVLLHSLLYMYPASALVNPDDTGESIPDWFATILLVNEELDFHFPLCKGSLVHEQWVLSSSACFFDVFKVLRSIEPLEGSEYKIIFGDSEELHEIINMKQSDDGLLHMFQLRQPVEQNPVTLSGRSYESLLGEEITIPGIDYSIAS